MVRIRGSRLDGRRLAPAPFFEAQLSSPLLQFTQPRCCSGALSSPRQSWRNAGARNINFGTSVGNQIAAIKQLRRYSDDSSVDIRLPQWKSFPLAWKVLLELNPPTSDPRPRRHLVVKYRDAHPGDAHIEVEELPNS